MMAQQMYADLVELRSELQISDRKLAFEQGKVLYADKLIDEYRSRITILESALKSIADYYDQDTYPEKHPVYDIAKIALEI